VTVEIDTVSFDGPLNKRVRELLAAGFTPEEVDAAIVAEFFDVLVDPTATEPH
jgi:hypothetical protein